ncbi:hypothetical protein V6Z05_15055 [Leptospira venezuelensis]|uniref:hypothetical protein n=1 Tax=Leptospira venezuelensis TaxID=1958811 RepID=UPI0012FFA1BE|nr:hypothetical protein [Leptospira venezuelensis]
MGQGSECFDDTQESHGLKFLKDHTIMKSDIFPVYGVSERLSIEKGKWSIETNVINFEAPCAIIEGGECLGACLYERKQPKQICINECGLSDKLKEYGKLDLKLVCVGEILLKDDHMKFNLQVKDLNPIPGFSRFSKAVSNDDFCFFDLK